ncbi:MAG: flagellar assembly protein FliW [Spirochaetaceae bacterium]|nr:flagellar assembly protein FliW [Spirochaetaceae bacterium]
MIVETKAYGSVEINERQRITISSGLYGFEGLENYVLMDARQRPFYWLQSVDVQDVAFVLIDPKLIRLDYDAKISSQDFEALGLDGSQDDRFLQFAIVTIPDERQDMTANLQGPIIINKESREGRQCISQNENWHVRHNILEEMAAGKNAC